MQIESFHYFIALARTGSFYRAAKEVFISQQGLSKAIASLESELGMKLVTRESRGVRLTGAGEVFLSYAERIVGLHDEMINTLVAPEKEFTRSVDPLSVRATYYPIQIAAGIRGGMLFTDRLAISETRFNDIIEMAEGMDGTELLVLDLHPCSRHLLDERRNLVFEPLFTTRYGIIWHEDEPPAAGGMLHRDDVARLPLALNSQRDMEKYFEWLFRDYPAENVTLRAASPRLLLEYVQASPGRFAGFDSFGFMLSGLDAAMPTDGIRFTPLSTPEAVCEIGALYDKRHRPSLRVRHAIDRLKAFLASEYGMSQQE